MWSFFCVFEENKKICLAIDKKEAYNICYRNVYYEGLCPFLWHDSL